MGIIGCGIMFFIGTFLGSLAMIFTYKEYNSDCVYRMRQLEDENRVLRARQEPQISKEEYHPENMERMTAKEIKQHGRN